MSNLNFIDSLSKDLPPVRPVSETRLSLALLLIFLISTTVFTLVLKISPRWLPEPLFIVAGVGLILLSISSIHCAVRSALPGRAYSRWAIRIVWISGMLVVLGLGLGLFTGLTPSEHIHLGLHTSGFKCSIAMLGFSLVRFLATFWALHKLAPTEHRRTAKWLGVAAGACGALGIAMHCSLHEPLHWITWHFSPTLILIVGAILIGRRWFSW